MLDVRAAALMPLLALIAVLAVAASLAIGPAPIGPVEAWMAVFGRGDAAIVTIVQEIRLPRVILSLAVGAILAAAGAALQGYLRNPLAEPAVLGVSNAAALGAVLAIYTGLASQLSLALPASAVASALGALACVVLLSRRSDSGLTLILAGLAVASLCGAGISLVLNLSPNPFAAMEVTFWLLGSLQDRSMSHVVLALPLILVGGALILLDRRGLDALSLGEEAARSLGFNLDTMRLRLLGGIALGVGAAVAVSGAIGFLGLIVPHAMRAVIGPQPSRLIVPSALAGAVLLTLADTLVRVLPATNEIRLGVVTTLLGVPFFLVLVLRARRAGAI